MDEILKQLQPLIGTLIGLVLTWALGEAVRYLRAKGAAAAADGDVARATALELAAHAAVAAAEELAKAAEKRGESKMNGASKQALAQSLMPAGVDATTAQRVVLAAVARTFGTGATGTQTVGRAPSMAIAPSPASAKTGGAAALTLALAVATGLSGCGAAAIAWPAACSASKSGVVSCTCKRQVLKVTRDATGAIKRVRHLCDGVELPFDSRSQGGDLNDE